MKSKYLAVVAIFSLTTGSAMAAPISYNISQTGFAAGGSITGMFTGDDLNIDGIVGNYPGEVTAFMASWGGNATIGATSWTIGDLLGLVYELGTGDIGDDGSLLLGIEGLVTTNAEGFTWDSGNGPGGFGAFPGGGIQGPPQEPPTGPIITTSNLITVTSKVPEPATLALFGIGLAGLGFARKNKQKKRSA